MKKVLISLMLIFAILVSFISCGEYNPPSNSNGQNAPSDTDNGGADGEQNGSQSNTGPTFTAAVMVGGKPYSPPDVNAPNALKVRWTDGKTYKTETVGEDGVATCSGLDGDYVVTLINLPDGYTYNPNIYTAGNDNPSVVIELKKISRCMGASIDLYNCIEIENAGEYRATITKEDQVIFFQFSPTRAGRYVIESWMDVSAQMYNPIADIYIGSSSWKQYNSKLDTGGVSSGYTKNFKKVIEVDQSFIGNSYTFGVWVEGKDAVYPVNVDFSISYKGEYHYDGYVESSLIIPTLTKKFDFTAYRSYLAADRELFGDSEYHEAYIRMGDLKIFDQRGFRYNESDGYYHVYDEEKYAWNGGWGPVLYANITIPTTVIPTAALNQVEASGNKNLTVNQGKDNYKLFIEGYSALIANGVNYFCVGNCPCLKTNGGCCPIEDNCTKCTKDCRHIPRASIGQLGYANIAIEGRCPVTEELQIFLQKYSVSQKLFSDGLGIAEAIYGYDSYEDSQWLFACGYYSD